MPQFVPPPLIEDPADRSWAQPPTPRNRDEEYAFEIDCLFANLPKLQQRARDGTIPDAYRRVYWMLLLGTLPEHRPKRDGECERMLRDYEALTSEVLSGLGDEPLPLDDDPRRIDVDIPRTMPALHFFASHEGSPSCAAAREEFERQHSGAVSPVAPEPDANADADAEGDATEAAEEDGEEDKGPASARPAAPPARPVPFATNTKAAFTPNQLALRRVLHLFARLNAGAGYVQGMNEIVGHLMYAMCGGKGTATRQTEADAFFSFQRLHQFVGDNFQRELDLDANGVKGTLTAFSVLLMRCDYDLYKALDAIALVPEYYAFRWITLMFSQDFTTPDVLSLWDFLLSYREDLDAAVLFTAVAMTTLVRERLLDASFSEAIQLLQQYPADVELRQIKRHAAALMDEYGFDAARDGRLASASQHDDDGQPGTVARHDDEQPSRPRAGSAADTIRGFMSGLRKRFGR